MPVTVGPSAPVPGPQLVLSCWMPSKCFRGSVGCRGDRVLSWECVDSCTVALETWLPSNLFTYTHPSDACHLRQSLSISLCNPSVFHSTRMKVIHSRIIHYFTVLPSVPSNSKKIKENDVEIPSSVWPAFLIQRSTLL